MIVVTTEGIPGCRVTRIIGQVFGVTVRTRGIGGNFAAGLKSIGGGEVKSYTKLAEDTRREALDRMVQNATAMGANAICMMRFDSSEMMQSMTEMVAYGTAVVVEFTAQPQQAAIPQPQYAHQGQPALPQGGAPSYQPGQQQYQQQPAPSYPPQGR